MELRLNAAAFLIVESGTDLEDSATFKTNMASFGIGKDITPELPIGKRNTKYKGVTHLSALDWVDTENPELLRWIRKLSMLRPHVLYLSGHNPGASSIADSVVIYNPQNVVLRFDRAHIQVGEGKFMFSPLRTKKGEKLAAPIGSLASNLRLVIMDACGRDPSAAQRVQDVFTGGHGKPTILGFVNGPSPEKGTAALYRVFVRGLHSERNKGSVTLSEERVISCWVNACCVWKVSQYRQNLGVLTGDGRRLTWDGKVRK